MRRATVLLFCLVCISLAGCGNKGPLVMPSQQAAAPQSAPAAPASAASAPTAFDQRR